MGNGYHRENLKDELLEAGIRIISEKGFEALSLRKIAAQCGVSHNAAYRHFESKAQFIDACRNYVTVQMMAKLEAAYGGAGLSAGEALRRLSIAYVVFYQTHPTYYSLLYRNADVKLTFSMEATAENYPPLCLFIKACRAYGTQRGWAAEECLKCLIQLWSLLHGLTALAISANVEWDDEWQAYLNDFLK